MDWEARCRRRGPDPARGHGRDRVPCGLHQARAALDLSGAAPRRQGPRRHGDARRGFRHPPVRRQHPHAGDLLLVQGTGLQGEGVAPAAGRAERQGQGAGEHAADRAGRAHHHHHAAARGRGVLGQARRDVRHIARHGSPQQAVGFRPGESRRQDRHEAGCGRAIVDVQICTEDDDVLLTTANGQCIRFAVPEVRVFKGRDSMGVRGINLAEGDAIISMAILRHMDGDRRRAGGLSQDASRRHGRSGERTMPLENRRRGRRRERRR